MRIRAGSGVGGRWSNTALWPWGIIATPGAWADCLAGGGSCLSLQQRRCSLNVRLLLTSAPCWLPLSSHSDCMRLGSVGVSGLDGRRAQQELITGSRVGFFLSSCSKKSKPVSPLIILLCYFHIYFQQIETELRHMELIKDQYQRKNYEQVDDLHTLFTTHVKSQTWAPSPTVSLFVPCSRWVSRNSCLKWLTCRRRCSCWPGASMTPQHGISSKSCAWSLSGGWGRSWRVGARCKGFLGFLSEMTSKCHVLKPALGHIASLGSSEENKFTSCSS